VLSDDEYIGYLFDILFQMKFIHTDYNHLEISETWRKTLLQNLEYKLFR